MNRTRTWGLGLLLLYSATAFPQDDGLVVPLVPPSKTSKKPRSKTRSDKRRKKVGETMPAQEASDEAWLSFRSGGNALGATVFLDGLDIGKLPMGPLKVAVGQHSVVIRKEGYREFQRLIQARAGSTEVVEPQMALLGGILRVAVNMEGAEVWLDNELKGLSPLEAFLLSAGTFDVSVRKAGFVAARQTVRVRPGGQYHLSFELAPQDRPEKRATLRLPSTPESNVLMQPAVKREAPLHKRWYIWVSAAAVVAAAATWGIVAAAQPPSQPRFSPLDVCGPQGCTACVPASACAGGP